MRMPIKIQNHFGFLGFLVLSTSAQAYIPPSQFILKTWANKHAGAKTLRVKTVVYELENGKATENHFNETLVFSPETLGFKSWVSDDQDKKLYSVERTLSSSSILAQMLLAADSRQLIQALKNKEVPIPTEEDLLKLKTEDDRRKAEIEALLRWNNGIAWAIGVDSSKIVSKPQLWFEKDSFLPLRMIIATSNDSGDLNEIRFDGFRFFREFPFPKTFQFLKKDVGVFSTQLKDLTFVAEKVNVKPQSNGEFTEIGNSKPSAIKSLIRLYYEHCR